MKTLKIFFIVFTVLVTSVGASSLGNGQANALSGSQFKAGDIIDDNVFFNGSSMTTTQIQNFLNAKVPTCDTNGTKTYSGSQTRAQYGRAHDNPPPYTCLKNYKHDTPSKPGESGLCSALSAKNDQTAAQMINSVSTACHVSQKVILVMLQKEQGLVTDEWPWSVQYKTALGYGCPDGSPCDSQYYGLFNQIYNAVRQFQRYKADPDNWNYPPHMTSSILYNPRTSCGRKSVSIVNQATSGLYNYTPYVPNSAALSNLHGSGDSCSSYGNRNFWVYFNEWFGSTQSSYIKLSEPRWMQLSSDDYKVNPGTGENVDGLLVAGRQLHFDSKIYVNGNWYIRTANDTVQDYNKGILVSNLVEVPMNYSSLDEPRWMQTNGSLHKVNPQTGASVSDTIASGTQAYFDTQVQVGGVWYLRTALNTVQGSQAGIPLTSLSDITIAFEGLSTPRYMQVKTDTHMYDIKTKRTVGSLIKKDAQIYFDRKVTVNGLTYLRNGALSSPDDYLGIPLNALQDISLRFSRMSTPRLMQLKTNAYKRDPITGRTSGSVITTGTKLDFDNKVEVGGLWYIRTKTDTANHINLGILLTDLKEVSD